MADIHGTSWPQKNTAETIAMITLYSQESVKKEGKGTGLGTEGRRKGMICNSNQLSIDDHKSWRRLQRLWRISQRAKMKNRRGHVKNSECRVR
jgi:hypothetical protein